jgi:hypothetical protein
MLQTPISTYERKLPTVAGLFLLRPAQAGKNERKQIFLDRGR